MFIKTVKKKNKDLPTIYTYHRLMESYRTERGPRQMTVLNLGKLELPKEKCKSLADRIEQIVSGQQQIIPAEPDVEKLAQHYAPLLVKKKIEIPSYKEEGQEEEEYRMSDKLFKH